MFIQDQKRAFGFFLSFRKHKQLKVFGIFFSRKTESTVSVSFSNGSILFRVFFFSAYSKLEIYIFYDTFFEPIFNDLTGSEDISYRMFIQDQKGTFRYSCLKFLEFFFSLRKKAESTVSVSFFNWKYIFFRVFFSQPNSSWKYTFL